MDHLLEVIVALLYWRVLLSTSGAFIVALAASQAFAWFSGVWSIALVLLAFGLGLLWHGRASVGLHQNAPIPAPQISWPVAALGFALVGFFWGGFFSEFAGSLIAGGAILTLCPLAIGVARTVLLGHPLKIGYITFSTAALLVGFMGLAALQSANSRAPSTSSIERTASGALPASLDTALANP